MTPLIGHTKNERIFMKKGEKIGKMKFVKKGINPRVGKYYQKTFYEYELFTEEERNRITEGYTRQVNSIYSIAGKSENVNRRVVEIPRIKIPSPSINDIELLKVHHNDEGIFDVVQKHNNNIQIYVNHDKLECAFCGKISDDVRGKNSHERVCEDNPNRKTPWEGTSKKAKQKGQ